MATDARMIQWATEGQIELAKHTEYGKGDWQGATLYNVPNYPVAGGFIFVEAAYCNGLKLWPRTKRQIDYMNRYRLGDTSVGEPEFFWLGQDSVNLYPTPGTAGETLIVTRVPRPADLAAIGDPLSIPDDMFQDLIDFCLQKFKEMDEDFTAAQYFGTKFKGGALESAFELQTSSTESYPVVRDAPGENW